MPRIFPCREVDNLAICVCGDSSTKDFSVLITNVIPDASLLSVAQCFPLYTYVKSDGMWQEQNDGGERYVRRENISDAMLTKFRERVVSDQWRVASEEESNRKPLATSHSLTKEDIFYYIYGILHSPSYRERFAADLKKQLPRIPMVEDFWTFSEAGRKLAALHVNYESGEMYPLVEVRDER